MSRFSHPSSSAVALAALSIVALAASSASADINGLNPASYTYNQNPNDTGNAPVLGTDSIELTTGINQIRSLWFNARQDVTSPFTISFTYQAPNLTSYNPQGLLLVLQNDTDGANAVGFANGSSTLGFTNISPSIASAIYLDPDDFTSTGIFRNGTIGSGLTTTAPVNAFDGQPINVTLAYDGSSFALTMSENGVTYSPSPYLVGSLASSLGSSTAYVGFTAYTGAGVSDNSNRQILSNFRFTSGVPEPTTAATLVGGAGLLALRRRRAGAAL